MATKKISKKTNKKINKKTNKYSRLSKKLNVKKRVTKLKGGGNNITPPPIVPRNININKELNRFRKFRRFNNTSKKSIEGIKNEIRQRKLDISKLEKQIQDTISEENKLKIKLQKNKLENDLKIYQLRIGYLTAKKMGLSKNQNTQLVNTEIFENFHKIIHFWYREWSDHGAPDILDLKLINNNTVDTVKVYRRIRFITFVDKLCTDINKFGGGTVIHCSAGVGRTGTLFVILKLIYDNECKDLTDLINRMKISYTDIKNAIIYARLRRNLMVQSYEQYIFLCKLFGLTFAEKNNIESQNYIKESNSDYITKKEFVNIENPIKTQFGNIDDIFKLKEKTDTDRHDNTLPYEHNMVRVKVKKENDTVVVINVNASIVNQKLNFCEEEQNIYCNETNINGGVVIAAQCPLTISPEINSQPEFLAMLGDVSLNIKRIVMLTGLVEKGKSKCEDYTNGFLTNIEKLESTQLTKTQEQLKQILSITEFALVPNSELHNGFLSYKLTRGIPIDIPMDIPPLRSSSVGSIIIPDAAVSFSVQPDIQENTSVLNKEDVIKRLTDFLNAKIGVKKIISFCDCKMILLYMISYPIEFPIDKQYLIKLIETKHIPEKITKVKDNGTITIISGNDNLIFNVYNLITPYYPNIPMYSEITVVSCRVNNKLNMSLYLNRETEIQDYKILFGVSDEEQYKKIVTNMECIFNNLGDVIEGLNFDTLGNPFDPHTNFSCESSA